MEIGVGLEFNMLLPSTNFEKTIKQGASKFKVSEPELLKYFEREMLGEYQWQ